MSRGAGQLCLSTKQAASGEHDVLIKSLSSSLIAVTIGDEMQCRRIVRGRNCKTLQSKSNDCARLGAYLKVVWDDVGKSEPLWGALH